MSEATPATPPPQYEDVLPPTTTTKPPYRHASVVFTLVPFAAYLLGRFIPLPTYHIVDSEGMRDWSDSNNILAVGIMPWIMAAVMIEIMTMIIPGLPRVRHQDEIGQAQLRRVMNIFGLVIAVIHAAWITFDLTYIPDMIIDPSVDLYLPKPHVSSPILAFGSLLLGAITLKVLIDFIYPRTLLDKHGKALAVALLLATIYTLTRENSPFGLMDVRIMDLIRIAVNLLKAGMLVSFILLRPPFLWPISHLHPGTNPHTTAA